MRSLREKEGGGGIGGYFILSRKKKLVEGRLNILPMLPVGC